MTVRRWSVDRSWHHISFQTIIGLRLIWLNIANIGHDRVILTALRPWRLHFNSRSSRESVGILQHSLFERAIPRCNNRAAKNILAAPLSRCCRVMHEISCPGWWSTARSGARRRQLTLWSVITGPMHCRPRVCYCRGSTGSFGGYRSNGAHGPIKLLATKWTFRLEAGYITPIETYQG